MIKKKKKKNYGGIIILIFVVFAIGMIYGLYTVAVKNINTSPYFSKYNKKIENRLAKQLDNQNQVDNKIRDILDNGDYSFNDPCILVNPYGISPLSAVIIFKTNIETSINVNINDENIYDINPSKNHIIPVYGLYSNAKNIIKLTNDMNEVKELTINVEPLNDNIDIKVEKYLNNKSHLFMLGDLNTEHTLRGFDKNNNLIFYLEFGNISYSNFFSGYFQIAYNENIKLSSKSIKLEMDYLGRIKAIHKGVDDLIKDVNLNINNKDYIYTPVNIYPETINDYELTKISNSTAKTKSTPLKSSDIKELLVDAPLYMDEFNISTNSSFITYDIKECSKLVLVSKNSNYSYSYDLDDEIINTDLKGTYSAYVIKNDTYYNLLITLEF